MITLCLNKEPLKEHLWDLHFICADKCWTPEWPIGLSGLPKECPLLETPKTIWLVDKVKKDETKRDTPSTHRMDGWDALDRKTLLCNKTTMKRSSIHSTDIVGTPYLQKNRFLREELPLSFQMLCRHSRCEEAHIKPREKQPSFMPKATGCWDREVWSVQKGRASRADVSCLKKDHITTTASVV